jgi:hypothetical protein
MQVSCELELWWITGRKYRIPELNGCSWNVVKFKDQSQFCSFILFICLVSY